MDSRLDFHSHQQFLQSLAHARPLLTGAANPLVLYDDDPDGLSSFLMVYKTIRRGNHYPIKTSPSLGPIFLKKISEHAPDLVVVLDKPLLDEAFVRGLELHHIPLLWFDHHEKEPISSTFISLYNPHDYGITNYPTSQIIYYLLEDKRLLWIACIGTLGDWTLPLFIDDAKRSFPELFGQYTTPQDLLFASPWKKPIQLFGLVHKLPSPQYKKAVGLLLEVESVYELIDETTSHAKKLWSMVQSVQEQYEYLLSQAKAQPLQDGMRIFTYEGNGNSFTKELSNELLYCFPHDLILVGRIHQGQIKLSLRSSNLPLRAAVTQALQGIAGHGGGHEYACGAGMDVEMFPLFLRQLRAALSLKK
ncbi:MAG: DHHA1 domain-containing protein [Candidatus Woesearchaeota archaeon]